MEAQDLPTFELSSGYTIRVKTLGPFALDPIRAQHRDPGEFTYKVQTKGEGTVDFVYDPPAEPPPSPNEGGDERDWEIYKAWQAHERRRKEIANGFERAAANLLLLNCITVVSGPHAAEDDEWLKPLAPFVPDELSYTDRMLLFLKTQVFAVPFAEWAAIRQICVAPEVDLEGIFNALSNFRTELGWSRTARDMGSAPVREDAT